MKKILIVEDDPGMQKIYEVMFEGQADEYQAMIEGDACRAFRKLAEDKFDLVILDIIMEPMDGESFFACLREDPREKAVPVIVVSVLDPPGLEYMAKYGKVDFLQKPVTGEQLFDKIHSILK